MPVVVHDRSITEGLGAHHEALWTERSEPGDLADDPVARDQDFRPGAAACGGFTERASAAEAPGNEQCAAGCEALPQHRPAVDGMTVR